MTDLVQDRSGLKRQSLLLRLGLSMGLIISLAMIAMLSSIFIAETSEGFAAAINQAGTLRMQSYRIASSLVHETPPDSAESASNTRGLVAEFEERLLSPRIHNVLRKGASAEVRDAYRTVEHHWQITMHPRLQDYLTIIDPPNEPGTLERVSRDKDFYLANVDDFVQEIHAFVKVLELDADRKNEQLRLIQIISIVLTLLVAAVSLYLAQKTVLTPLRDLLQCARAARHGDLSVRSRHMSEDELGQLGYAFNLMAENLSKMYADLEQRVQAKTADLERSNRSLELLYGTSKRLNESSLTDAVLEALINDIEQLIGVNGGTICLGGPGDSQAFRLASTIPKEPGGLGSDCAACLGDGSAHQFEVANREEGSVRRLYSIPIRDQEKQFGVLLVELPENLEGELEEWKKRLLETVASHIALAINTAQQASQSRMLALLEERSVIARELHDSIAQSLSYLKIQVSRLEKSITEENGKQHDLQITAGLRSALNGAYRQLRELLATFRLRITEAGLGVALEDTVREYRERSEIRIELINHMANCQFEPNSEIHVIQIIREALSNVIRHANATQARVMVECSQDGRVTILVEDDGVGIDDQQEMMLHYGMPIMKERAERLGGRLEVGQSSSGGTRVKLTFAISEGESAGSRTELIPESS